MFAGENVSGASSLRFGRLDDAEKPGAGADAGSFTGGASPTADLTPSFWSAVRSTALSCGGAALRQVESGTDVGGPTNDKSGQGRGPGRVHGKGDSGDSPVNVNVPAPLPGPAAESTPTAPLNVNAPAPPPGFR